MLLKKINKLFLLGALIFCQDSFPFDHSHRAYGEILKDHLFLKENQALVDYRKLKNSPDRLNSYLNSLSKVSSKEFKTWEKNHKLAFLINAYNAFTLKLIISNYPVKSIKDIGTIFAGPWKKKFFSLFGQKTHLDHVEHKLIRKQFREPRIHFALNCASISCPNLQKFPFTGDQLDNQLHKSAKFFLQDTKKNYLGNGSLFISKIFKWYGKDFNISDNNYKSFIAELITENESLRKRINMGSIKIRYLDYDWGLNGK